VRFRSRRWFERTFASPRAAHTFARYLHHHHVEHWTQHPTAGAWVVWFRGRHTHHYGTYAARTVADRVAAGLRSEGFASWVRWHRRWF
jgi:hypothetical protein